VFWSAEFVYVCVTMAKIRMHRWIDWSVKKAGIAGFLYLTFVSLECLMAQSRIVYFGDSITEGWIDARKAPENAFPAKTDSILQGWGYRVESVNAGIGGQTTSDALQRISEDVLFKHPDIAVIAFGSNDYFILDVNTGSRVAQAAFKRNISTIVEMCLGVGIKPVLLGIPPILERRFYQYTAEEAYVPLGGAQTLNAEYDAIIEAAAQHFNVPYVHIDFGDETERAVWLGFDGVHPLASGHMLIAHALAQTLENQIKVGPLEPLIMENMELYPSPVNFTTTGYVVFRVGVNRPHQFALHIYNNAGMRLRSIIYNATKKGTHYVLWDGKTDRGTIVESGAYFLQIVSPTGRISKHLIVL